MTTPDRRRVVARRAVDAVLVVALVLLLAVAALRLVDTSAHALVVLQTVTPLVLPALVLLAAAALLLRRRWVALGVGVAVVAGVALAAPAWSTSTQPKVKRDFTVLSANLDEGRADTRQLLDAVRTRAVDVLVLVEATPQAVSALDAAGGAKLFPHREGQARPGVVGTVVLSRFPLTLVDAGVSPSGDSLQPVVDVATSRGRLRLRAVHPTPPLSDRTDRWHASLESLGDWARAQSPSVPLLLAGDFNASAAHPVYRRLAEGLVDGQEAAGRGWVRTWPMEGRRVPPYVALDHQLSRGMAVLDVGQVTLNRSDHAAVWVAYGVRPTR